MGGNIVNDAGIRKLAQCRINQILAVFGYLRWPGGTGSRGRSNLPFGVCFGCSSRSTTEFSFAAGRAPRLSSGDAASHFSDLIDIVDTVGQFRVLFSDVEIEVPAEGGRGEGLATEAAVLVFGGAEPRSTGVRGPDRGRSHVGVRAVDYGKNKGWRRYLLRVFKPSTSIQDYRSVPLEAAYSDSSSAGAVAARIIRIAG